ncbi:HAD family hydrolase [Clostridiales bacterium COT073_COT-073]|nr:HAD family hydrolase [Clostridiales bacterium COT073_COT-073]
MKYQYILFDLDGTLTDSAEGITKSMAHALRHFNVEIENLKDLNQFVGPPLEETFIGHYGFSKEESDILSELFRQRFAEKGKFENRLYQGIKELLQALKRSGRKLYVATSKPTIYSKEILDYFEISEYFEDIIGSELNGERTEKADVIAYVLDKHGINKEKAIMVGDRKYDICGAREHGLNAIGVLYGFGDRLELESHGAQYIALNVSELEQILVSEV